MLEITSQGPLNRHITEYLTSNKRIKRYRCKTVQNPDYFTPDGVAFYPIDAAFRKDTSTESAGGIWLRDKAVVSVGTKKADDAYKIIGLRPDENQGGSEQFEISVESIEVNGKSQTVNLRDRVEVTPIVTQFGDNLFVQRARQRCRVMVGAASTDDGFKVTLRIHTAGLTLVYQQNLDEYWFYNEKGQFRFRLGKPYLVDVATMNPLRPDNIGHYPQLVKHSLTEISKGEYLYVKEPTEEFGKVTLPERFLIDADTVYSSVSDGSVWHGATPWASCHDAASGSSVDDASVSSFVQSYYDNFGYQIQRAFFFYDVSSLSGTVISVTENYVGGGTCNSDISVQKGTQSTTISTADFDAFTGSVYDHVTGSGYPGSDVFTYSAGGISDVQSQIGTGVHKTCAREYTYDVANSAPPTYDNLIVGFSTGDQSGTAYDPFIYVDLFTGPPPSRARSFIIGG